MIVRITSNLADLLTGRNKTDDTPIQQYIDDQLDEFTLISDHDIYKETELLPEYAADRSSNQVVP